MYEDYYTSADLVVGAVVNVWGRKLVLCDCDDFTKEYYKTKFGIGKPVFSLIMHNFMHDLM